MVISGLLLLWANFWFAMGPGLTVFYPIAALCGCECNWGVFGFIVANTVGVYFWKYVIMNEN
jgi:hypothetical protein